MRKVVQVILLIAIVVMGYLVIDSPLQKERFDKVKTKREKEVIARLVDIRKAQEAFKEKFGKFNPSLDSLINFLKNDSMPQVIKEGFVTDSMLQAGINAMKSIKLGLIIRDTVYVSIKKDLFGEDYAIDSMKIVPYSNGAFFECEASEVNTQANVTVQVVEVRTLFDNYLGDLNKQEITNLKAYASKYEKYPGLKFGDLREPNNNAGNWE